MAVEAAPDFHHEDARAGCPAAVHAPKCPVAPGHRAISLKVILLSAVLAIAGIQDAHSEPEACNKTGLTPEEDWTLRAAIQGNTVRTGKLFKGSATSIHCIYERPVKLWFKCCDQKFYGLLRKQYGKSIIEGTVGDPEAKTIGIEVGAPNAPAVAGLSVHLVSAAAKSLDLKLKLEVLANQAAAKKECERQFKGEDPQIKGKVVPEEPTPYLNCAVKKKTPKLTQRVTKWWWWVWPYDEYEKLESEITEDDPAEDRNGP